MFVRRQFLPLAYSLPFLNPEGDPPAGGGNPPADPPEVKFDEAQQRKVNDLIAAERKATAERVKADLATQAAADKVKADEERERKEAEGRGEFDKVKTSLEQKASAAESERDRIREENETFATIFEAQYAADVKEVPDEIWAELKPADDAPLTERITALKRAQKIAGLVSTAATPTGSRPIPKPGSQQTSFDEEVAKQRRKPSYSL